MWANIAEGRFTVGVHFGALVGSGIVSSFSLIPITTM